MLNPSLVDLDLSSEELKEIAKLLAERIVINDYESMSEDRLLSALKVSESLKESENNFDDVKPKIIFSKSKIEKIREKFKESKHKFSKSKVNEIRGNLYEIENKKNLSALKIKKVEKYLLKLEKNLSKQKK